MRRDNAGDTRYTEFFQLLESLAHEAFSSQAMDRCRETSRFLSALSVLSRCLADALKASVCADTVRELLDREREPRQHAWLEAELSTAEYDRDLAELELRAVAVPLYALAGAFGEKSQAAEALRALSRDVEDDRFTSIFPDSEGIDALLPMVSSMRDRLLKAV